ncbi:MAG TPA: amidohydrolase family protein, partial [Agriterribacter sp.]|nr:amidohydrolase family protein [Agriterribacter sp.]
DWKVDFVKITENTLKGPLFLKSVKAAHARGYIVSGHVPIDLTIEELVDAGLSSVEHASYLLRLGCNEQQIVADLKAGKITSAEANHLYQTTFDPQVAMKNYAVLGKKGLYVTPTLIGSRQLAYLNENDYTKDSMMVSYLTKAYAENYTWRIERMKNDTPEQSEERKKRTQFTASQVPLMQKAGIPILAGSDEAALNSFVYPGESLISELQLFQDAGMQPVHILQAATINGAKFMRKSATMGSVDEGKIADMVILDENPLENINATQRIYGVFTKGQYFDRNALNKILQHVKEAKIKLDTQREMVR